MKISIVIPCLNEEKAIGKCIEEASAGLRPFNVQSEIIVADNGSTDSSVSIAKRLGATVINVPKRGYGAALKAGILASQGEYVVMGDSDGSYDFTEVGKFIEKFEGGYDIVLGNRFLGGIEKGAMPFLNRYVGNPLLTFITRFLYGKGFGDTQCGLRGGRRQALLDLNLKSDQFEYASEMVVRALQSDFRLAEVPIHLRNDDPSRKPHLRPFRDGFRHLKFLLGAKMCRPSK